jgi:hypothetical protein
LLKRGIERTAVDVIANKVEILDDPKPASGDEGIPSDFDQLLPE